MDEFIMSHPPPAYYKRGGLPRPVIIPQRRPRDYSRGFMRAYAPVLADNGITQRAFLDFLKAFDLVHKRLPYLTVINTITTTVFIPMDLLACAYFLPEICHAN